MNQQEQSGIPVTKSSWPTTFGVLGIIFGIFGFILAGSQVANTLIMEHMGSSLPYSTPSTDPEHSAFVDEAMETMTKDLIELGKTKIYADGAMLILGIVLFIGGLLLLQRYRISKKILLGWSYAKIFFGFYSAYLTQKMFTIMGNGMGGIFEEEMSKTSGGSSGPPPFDFAQFYEVIGMVTMILGSIWIALLPILLIIWLNRKTSIKDMADGYGWK